MRLRIRRSSCFLIFGLDNYRYAPLLGGVRVCVIVAEHLKYAGFSAVNNVLTAYIVTLAFYPRLTVKIGSLGFAVIFDAFTKAFRVFIYAIALLTEMCRLPGCSHFAVALFILNDDNSGGLDEQGPLAHLHVTIEGAGLIGIVNRDAVRLYLHGFLAISLLGKPQGCMYRQQQAKRSRKLIF